MANEEHLKILRKGVRAWNVWRKNRRDETPDLNRADLHRANLAGMDLLQADFRNANLQDARLEDVDLSISTLNDAILTGATLCSASLFGADLAGAKINGASLKNADLSGSDLSRADLSSTDLRWANLTDAQLRSANLAYATVGKTVLGNACLANVQGLLESAHDGPSFVDFQTVERSGGLPEKFLRGCGWSDWQIEAAKLCQPGLSNGQITDITYAIANKLIANPFTYYPAFISYSHEDLPFAEWLHDQLQARGVRCWRDKTHTLPGDDIYREVDRGINQYDKFLLCASQSSLTSWWVDNEIATLFAKEQRLMKERREKVHLLVTLDLDGYLFSEQYQNGKRQQLRERLAANFKGWQPDSTSFSAELDRVVKALRADDGARPQPPPSLLK